MIVSIFLGVTIQKAQPSVLQAFFDLLQNELPEYAKKLKEDALKAFDQVSEWARHKAEELKKKELTAPNGE